MAENKIKLDRHSWYLAKRMYREFMRPYFWMFVLACVAMVVASAMLAAIAYISRDLVEVFTSRDMDTGRNLAIAVLAIFSVRGVASLVHYLTLNWTGERVILDMQKRLYNHIIRSDLAFFQTNSTGTLISRLTHDVGRMRFAVSDALTGFGIHAFTVASMIGVMFHSDWVLACITFAALPLIIFPILLIGRWTRRISRAAQVEAGKLTAFYDETFRGARHVKAYGMETTEIARAGRIMERFFKINFQGVRVQSAVFPMFDLFGGIAIFAVMFYGGNQVLIEGKDPGAFASFIVALMLSYQPMRQLTMLNAKVQEGLASADRVFHALDLRETIVDKPTAKSIRVADGRVGFKNVRFEYLPNIPALDGISFEAPAGKTVALVGPSGAGKSTILNLIPRFYDVSDGTITVDGIDIRDIAIASLRANIGLVSQEISLFDDTIRANIAYGKPDASEAEVVRAAQAAAAHDFIVELPDGYDTIVGGQGLRLSGGQRQRVAIARAMLKNAPILLLDEATSALDTESERQVQSALKRLMKGRTTFVIAHRLSTVFDADVIYVIDDGKIVEAGTHRALLRRNGLYTRLHAMQSGPGREGGPAGEGERVFS